MRTLVEAAAGFPVILFTTALVVVVFFWLLVAVGAAAVNSFDSDIDLDALGMGGVPAAVAMSLLTALAWLLGVGATVMVTALASAGAVTGVLRLVLPVAGLFAAWRLTRVLVRPLRRLFTRAPRRPSSDRHGRGTAPDTGNRAGRPLPRDRALPEGGGRENAREGGTWRTAADRGPCLWVSGRRGG